MSDKYDQLKKNLKHLSTTYSPGILVSTMDGARIALTDLQEEIESLKAITELKNEMLQDVETRMLGVIDSRDKLQDANDIAIKALAEIAEFTASVTIEDKCKSAISEIARLQNE